MSRGPLSYLTPSSPRADLQKFACKTRGSGGGGGAASSSLFGGLVPMETLPGSGGRILVSGFWGVARHVNYTGEVLQAVALALPGVLASGGSLVPLLYPAYYVALFIPRCLDDDAQCEAKYGAKLWGAYRDRVPWRMVPGLW
jgi:protein-S-isoprenylcysteine O-methyltransferase Ste14